MVLPVQAPQKAMIFRIIFNDNDPLLPMLMITQPDHVHFCTIDKTMVSAGSFKKPKNKERDSSLPFFMSIVLIKTILPEELI